MAKKLDSHAKEKGTFFCSVSHDPEQWVEMIKVLPDFTSWAYIQHEPDTEEGRPHVHFLVRNNGTRSVQQIADKLGISPQYVQVCRKVVAFRRYMLHLDQQEKKQYTLDDICTNKLLDFKIAVQGNDGRDINDLFRDFLSLKRGSLTAEEFIQQNYIELSKMPFYQKIKTFDLLTKTAHRTT